MISNLVIYWLLYDEYNHDLLTQTMSLLTGFSTFIISKHQTLLSYTFLFSSIQFMISSVFYFILTSHIYIYLYILPYREPINCNNDRSPPFLFLLIIFISTSLKIETLQKINIYKMIINRSILYYFFDITIQIDSF